MCVSNTYCSKFLLLHVTRRKSYKKRQRLRLKRKSKVLYSQYVWHDAFCSLWNFAIVPLLWHSCSYMDKRVNFSVQVSLLRISHSALGFVSCCWMAALNFSKVGFWNEAWERLRELEGEPLNHLLKWACNALWCSSLTDRIHALFIVQYISVLHCLHTRVNNWKPVFFYFP